MIKYFFLLAILSVSIFPKDTFAQSIQTVDAPEKDDSLKILSWNIYMLPPAIKFTGKLKRASQIGEKLAQSDYDVIVLARSLPFRSEKKNLQKN
jgi:hypothetical protein